MLLASIDPSAPLIPDFNLAWIHISRVRQISTMAATAMSKIFGAASGRPYNTPSASSSTHTSATMTPTLARPGSPYIPELEVDSWCAVCDRLIQTPTLVSDNEGADKTESKLAAKGNKFDENGVPQFIKPMPARIPSKKLKASFLATIKHRFKCLQAEMSRYQRTAGQPGLKRSNTQTRLANLASKPTPIETAQPAVPIIPATVPVYNRNLYCSVECSDKDLVLSGEQVGQLEKEIQAMDWHGARDELPSPLWPGTESSTSASEGEESSKVESHSTVPKIISVTPTNATNDFDFGGYFDMAVRGVDYGLMERERRRSSQSQKGGPSILTGMMTKRTSSTGASAYGYGFNQTVSSSDSLSSMWSSSDGRTFSEASSASMFAGYGMPGKPFRGLTPLNRADSGNQSSGGPTSPNSRRPSMASARSLSFTKQAGTPTGNGQGVRTQATTSNMSRQASLVAGEPGSAPPLTSFQSYAASFHRTPSTTDLARPLPISPPSRPFQPLCGNRRSSCNCGEERDFQVSHHSERRGSSSTETMRGQNSFAPISLTLGEYLGSGVRQDALGATPTQRMTSNAMGLFPGELMRRSISRDSNKSRTDLDFPIFEEEEQQNAIDGGKKTRTRTASVASSSRSSKSISLARNGSYVFLGSPQTAITIGDHIVPQGSLPSKPMFCRSPPSPARHPLQMASSYDDKTITRNKRHSHREKTAPVQATGPIDRQRKFSETTRSFSWTDLEKEGKVTTYALPPAAIAKSNDTKKLFYFD